MSAWFDALTPTLWVLAAAGAFCVGFAKSGIPGFGLLFVAVFAAVFNAKQSTGLVLPMLILGDLLAIRNYRAHTQWSVVLRLLPWTVCGIGLGWWSLQHIQSNRTMQVLIGCILLSMIVLHFVRRWLQNRSGGAGAPPAAAAWPTDAASGGMIGFATMTANAAGPVTTLYFIARGLPKYEFLGTAAWFYCIVNLIKVPFSVNLGLINSSSLRINATLAVFVLLGAWFGTWVVKRVNQKWFEMTALGLTALAAINLLLDLTGRLTTR